ncbi:MAG: amidophosphoribosyltransferase [Verrucomicrobiae bacterium]|nr:amidophosphoribosyltransferase [Verrucomicrobiae bacterium]
MSEELDKPRDACGVFGVFGNPDAAWLTYYGLYALQHRGQESAGIVTCEMQDDLPQFHAHKGMGLASHVFNEQNLKLLKGDRAIGHVRYSTTGSSSLVNAQPLVADCSRGQIAIGHNGNLTNAAILRDELEAYGSIFNTTVDSEIILHLMALPTHGDRENNLVSTIKRIQGAFSLVILTENELIGVRDPYGFRPLCIGKIDGAYILSSESCALDQVHAKFVRDVEPGEIVIIDKNGLRSIKPFEGHSREAFCIFEYVYFARPDSNIANQNVYKVRVNLGRQLAREHPVEADMVVPVPDSGNPAALGYSLESGIPYEMAFVRNHYIGRTFLQPSQLIRDFSVRVKLNLIADVVRNKRVIVVDDSIVRGTTARARVRTMREAGAKEVHVRVSCPPHRNPCVYGIDFPTRDELIANKYSMDQIGEYLQCDSIGYLSLDGMIGATGHPKAKFCTACYTGEYPVHFDPQLDKYIIEKRRRSRTPLTDLGAEARQQRLL